MELFFTFIENTYSIQVDEEVLYKKDLLKKIVKEIDPDRSIEDFDLNPDLEYYNFDILDLTVEIKYYLIAEERLKQQGIEVVKVDEINYNIPQIKDYLLVYDQKFKLREHLLNVSNSGDTKKLKLLIDSGADVNVKNKYGKTSLTIASYKGFTEIVKLLLESGADPNTQDKEENSSLIYASYKGFTEIVKILLESGADINYKDYLGDTSFTIALYNGHIETANFLKIYNNF